MANIKSSYAVCVKNSEIIDQDGENKHQIVPGELVKIIGVNGIEIFTRHDIQIYDRNSKCFGKVLYQCDMANLTPIPDDVWAVVSELKQGSNVTLCLRLPYDNINVNFLIQSLDECPCLGPGRFFNLNIINTINLTEDDQFHIRIKHYNSHQSTYSFRVDHFIKSLVFGKMSTTASFATDVSNTLITKPFQMPTLNNQPVDDSHLLNLSKVPATIMRKISNISVDDVTHHTGMPLKQFRMPEICSDTDTNDDYAVTLRNNNINSHNKVQMPKTGKPVKENRALTANCIICCQKTVNQIKLNCEHIFCGRCLVELVDTNLENAYCPFQNGDYRCAYKIMVEDIISIVDEMENCLTESDGDGFNEVTHNNFNSEFNQDNLVNVNFTTTNELSFWQCNFCSYNENLIDSQICVICSKTKQNVFDTKRLSLSEYMRLLKLEENSSFIPNYESTACTVCTETIKPKMGVQLRGCQHNFCRTCIISYIEFQNQAEIKCPFDGCNSILDDREIRGLLSPQAYDRYLETSLHVGLVEIENGYQCCIQNCRGYWILTEGIHKYNCPYCGIENCVAGEVSHPTLDCKTYHE